MIVLNLPFKFKINKKMKVNHTLNELYYYRMLYNSAFFNMLPKELVHKSKKHNDGELCFGGGWFIVMADLPTGQISNHYELKDWDFFQIPEKEIADKWDKHTPQEASDRLRKYILEQQGKKKSEYKITNNNRERFEKEIAYRLEENGIADLCRKNKKAEGLENFLIGITEWLAIENKW